MAVSKMAFKFSGRASKAFWLIKKSARTEGCQIAGTIACVEMSFNPKFQAPETVVHSTASRKLASNDALISFGTRGAYTPQ